MTLSVDGDDSVYVYWLSEPVRTMGSSPVPSAMVMSIAILNCCTRDSIFRTLRRIMKTTTYFQASDLRDKVYALLGLSHDQSSRAPDYSMSPALVFENMTMTIIQENRNLDALIGNRNGAGPDDFPSWVPEPYGLNPSSSGWEYLDSPDPIRDSEYLPEIASDLLPEFDLGAGLMKAHGWRVGRISQVIGPFPAFIARDADTGRCVSFSDFMIQSDELRAAARTLESDRRDRYWRTLLMDMDIPIYGRAICHIAEPAPDELRQYFDVFVDLYADRIPADYKPKLEPAARVQAYLGAYTEQMIQNLQGRCFVAGDDGFVALGPMQSQIGDIVVALFGGRMCFALRETQDGFKLLRDAYVQGLVKGHVLGPDDAGSSTIETFTLC